MGKILGSWSGMRKYLEQEMLADSLHGRVRQISTQISQCVDAIIQIPERRTLSLA